MRVAAGLRGDTHLRRAEANDLWRHWFDDHGVTAVIEPTVPEVARLRGDGHDHWGTDQALISLTSYWNWTGHRYTWVPGTWVRERRGYVTRQTHPHAAIGKRLDHHVNKRRPGTGKAQRHKAGEQRREQLGRRLCAGARRLVWAGPRRLPARPPRRHPACRAGARRAGEIHGVSDP